MKAQFKYAFFTGLRLRGNTFSIIFIMNMTFIILGALNLLPFAAKVTAVSLGGVAIAVMLGMNVACDILIISRMFAAPGAYLHALTPAPRNRILLTGVITMLVKDIVTMTFVITSEVILSLQLAGESLFALVRNTAFSDLTWIPDALIYTAMLVAGYLIVLMIILFCITASKSIFYQKRAGGLLTALLSIGILYIVSISSILVAPFGTVTRYGISFVIDVGTAGTVAYVILLLAQAAALFMLTSKLMERRFNI